MVDSREDQTAEARLAERYKIVSLDGEKIFVVYTLIGNEINIVSAHKESSLPSQQNVVGHGQMEKGGMGLELTSGEKAVLQQRLGQTVGIEQYAEKIKAKGVREDIYDQKISPAHFDEVSQSKAPTLILLAGQGGAGKSKLAEAQEARFAGNGGAVVIDPDQLRTYSPGYYEDIRAESRTAADKANVKDWTKEAFVEALSRKTNVVMDGTGGNTAQVEERIALARAAGYRVELHVVAANGIDSWLGVLNRHEVGKLYDTKNPEITPEARFVPKNVHDGSAKGISETLGRVEYNGLADYLAVYKRGEYEVPIYENAQARNGGSLAAVEALEQERSRPRTQLEVERREETVKRIDALMEARGASEKERAEVAMIAFQGEKKGFQQTAGQLTADRRPEISADDYIRSASARKEYRAQAEGRVNTYVAELRQSGMSAEQVAKIESGLQRKLDNPAQTYGLKEGLELREMRKGVDQTSSIKDVRNFYAKQERVVSDVLRVKQAFGADARERRPEQAERARARTSWEQLGKERMADLRNNVALGVIKREDQPGHEVRIKKVIGDAAKRAIARDYDRTQRQTNEPRQSRSSQSGNSLHLKENASQQKNKMTGAEVRTAGGVVIGNTKSPNGVEGKIVTQGVGGPVSAKTISSADYINSEGARTEYRGQAETKILNYVSDLRKEGRSAADVARIENKLVAKLDNPITAYGVKQGLELREMRKEVDRTSSIKTVRDYYDKRAQVVADGRLVQQAFGRDPKGQTPAQIKQSKTRLSYQQLEHERTADLRRNVSLGHVNQKDYPAYAKKIKKVMSDARANALAQDFRQVERQTTTQRQGGGTSSGRSQTTRHRWRPMRGSCDFLAQRKIWLRYVK